MEQMQHQMMGYDRTSAMFSPDGRLLQVEYAKKAVKQGTSAIGIVCKDGVVLIADRRITEKLIIPSSVEKVFQVDEHIAATSTGYVMDGRVLIEKAQLMAQQHRVTNDEPISVIELVKEIADLKQMYTQVGGVRPFGVSILFAGIDENKKLFLTDPTGIYFEFKATAIGESEEEIRALLNKQYKDNMSMDDGIKLAIKALKQVLGKEYKAERIDGAYISASTKKFRKIEQEKIKKI